MKQVFQLKETAGNSHSLGLNTSRTFWNVEIGCICERTECGKSSISLQRNSCNQRIQEVHSMRFKYFLSSDPFYNLGVGYHVCCGRKGFSLIWRFGGRDHDC